MKIVKIICCNCIFPFWRVCLEVCNSPSPRKVSFVFRIITVQNNPKPLNYAFKEKY